MASSSLLKSSIPFFLLIAMALAGDPDILTDFIVPTINISNVSIPIPVDGNFFTFTGLRPVFRAPVLPPTFNVSKASMVQFPALNGQSVSYALLEFPPQGVNPPHTHPRASELLLVIRGSLEVGFVDTTNKLFLQTLQIGDIFVFPKGLMHYQFNANKTEPAVAISGFGSANPGVVSFPDNVFTSGIDSGILAIAFKTDVATINRIKAGLTPPPKMG